jgi:S1-C subfamily serine protease
MEIENAIAEIDARPSDSIVMALKFDVPIFVSETLFKDKAVSLGRQNDIEKKYGLTLQELSPALAEYFSFGSINGVFVSHVRKGSRAERDGIQNGDIFVEVGEQSVNDIMSMRKALSNSEASVKAEVFRNNRLQFITLHPK